MLADAVQGAKILRNEAYKKSWHKAKGSPLEENRTRQANICPAPCALRLEPPEAYAAVTKDAAQHRSWTFSEAVIFDNAHRIGVTTPGHQTPQGNTHE